MIFLIINGVSNLFVNQSNPADKNINLNAVDFLAGLKNLKIGSFDQADKFLGDFRDHFYLLNLMLLQQRQVRLALDADWLGDRPVFASQQARGYDEAKNPQHTSWLGDRDSNPGS